MPCPLATAMYCATRLVLRKSYARAQDIGKPAVFVAVDMILDEIDEGVVFEFLQRLRIRATIEIVLEL